MRNTVASGITAHIGADGPSHARYSFGAQFAEVKVDPTTGQLWVTRAHGVYGVGRVLNKKTATSQLVGGTIFGIGMAVMEGAEMDPRLGRVINASFSDYHVPMNSDIYEVTADFVDEFDVHVNHLGAKGVGELGSVGAAAAVANAVFNATGRRIRRLPIRREDLL